MSFLLENCPYYKDINNLSTDILKGFKPFFISLCGDIDLGLNKISNINTFGSYLYNQEKIFGFWDYKSQHISLQEHKIADTTINLEFYELNKFIHLVFPGDNGKIFEHIFSSNMIFQSDEFNEFKDTVKKYYITKKLTNYYFNNAQNSFDNYKTQGNKDIITLLKMFKDILTGINILKTSEIQINLVDLNDLTYKFSYINDLIDLVNSGKTYLEQDNKLEFYHDEIEKLLSLFESAQSKSNLFEDVRNKHKLYQYLAIVYSKDIFDREFNIPVMSIIDDPEFIKQAQQKLLLVSSPFAGIEKALDIKLSPQKNVFVPDLDRYFLVKNLKIQGTFFEFVDIETFVQQLLISNPFSLLALFNTDSESLSEEILTLTLSPEMLLSKQLYNTFKTVANNLYEKFKVKEELKYIPSEIIEMFAILIQGRNALKYEKFCYDFDPYISMFEAIMNKELSNKQIHITYEELNAEFLTSYKSTKLSNETPNQEYLKEYLSSIKKNHWLQ